MQREAIEHLMSSEFIGCAEGPGDLSSTYKQRLAEDLNKRQGFLAVTRLATCLLTGRTKPV